MAKTSKAKIRANRAYSQKAYDLISVRLYKGKKKELSDFILSTGESLNGFIVKAIEAAVIAKGGSIDLSEKTECRKEPKDYYGMILEFCKVPRSRKEIAKMLGLKTDYYAVEYANKLVETGQLKIVESTSSRARKMYQTAET